MTTYTDTSTLNTDPNDPVSSVLLTALKDNPVAVAEGASGAPKIAAAAMGILLFADSDTVTQPDQTTQTAGADVTRVDNIVIMARGTASSSGGSDVTGTYEYRLSDDGGSTWGSWQTVLTISTSGPSTEENSDFSLVDVSAHDTIQTRISCSGDGSDSTTITAYGLGVQGTTP